CILCAHKAVILQLFDGGALTAEVAKYVRHLRLQRNRIFLSPKRAAGSGASGGQPRAQRVKSGRVTDSAKRPESVTARPLRVDRSERNVSRIGERKRLPTDSRPKGAREVWNREVPSVQAGKLAVDEWEPFDSPLSMFYPDFWKQFSR